MTRSFLDRWVSAGGLRRRCSQFLAVSLFITHERILVAKLQVWKSRLGFLARAPPIHVDASIFGTAVSIKRTKIFETITSPRMIALICYRRTNMNISVSINQSASSKMCLYSLCLSAYLI